MRRDGLQIRVPGLPPSRIVPTDLIPRRSDDDQRLVERHEGLAQPGGVVAQERVDASHPRIINISFEELPPQLIGALAQRDAILFGDDFQVPRARLLQVAMS